MTDLQQTEAFCLLRNGALYLRRVGLQTPGENPDFVFAGFKKGAFSLYFGDAPSYHFDLEGRWQRAFIEPTHYLKGLDTRVRTIDRVREGANLVLKRRLLSDDETAALDLRVRGAALGLMAELEAGRLERQDPPEDKAEPLQNGPLGEFLNRIVSWDADAWKAHRTRYQATYGPLPFLPPDSQNAVVLQATIENEDKNREGFGRRGSGTERGPRVRSESEFQEHVEAVAALHGKRLVQARNAFLGGSGVLRLPQELVNGYLETATRALRIEPGKKGALMVVWDETPRLDGVHAFLDDFRSPIPSLDDLRGYRRRNLVHVSLGIESGDREVREDYGRKWKDEDLRAVVANLRAADIGLSILVLVGAGGSARAEQHIRGTAELLRSLSLQRGDTVFLLDERELRDPESPADERYALHGDVWTRQQDQLKQALAPLRSQGVKVLPYSLEKQWA